MYEYSLPSGAVDCDPDCELFSNKSNTKNTNYEYIVNIKKTT